MKDRRKKDVSCGIEVTMEEYIARKYKPNVAYELLIDGVYRYYGSHCVSKEFLYDSTILFTSGNPIRALYSKGELDREEYRDRVKILFIWEFDTKEEALARETELVTMGKKLYGDYCLNVFIGNNRTYEVPDWVKTRQRTKAKQLWYDRVSKDPSLRDFYVACGKKGLENNPVLLRSKQVIQFDGDRLVAVYPSIKAAARAVNTDASNIRRCANHQYRTVVGFRWEFANR